MINIDHSVDVDFNCQQMFDLVSNYTAYPEFIKSCVEASTKQAYDRKVLAQLTMSIAGFEQVFSTYTEFFPYEKITMDLAEGPFKMLKGEWLFYELEHGCRIRLIMQYELNRALEFLIGNKFKNSMVKMIDAFIKRAHEVYA